MMKSNPHECLASLPTFFRTKVCLPTLNIFYAKQGHAAIIVHYQNPNFVKHFVSLLYHYAVCLVECVTRNGSVLHYSVEYLTVFAEESSKLSWLNLTTVCIFSPTSV